MSFGNGSRVVTRVTTTVPVATDPFATSTTTSRKRMLPRMRSCTQSISALCVRRTGHLTLKSAYSNVQPISSRRHASGSRSRKEPSMMAFADGACRGNPGNGACGALIVDRTTQEVVASRSQFLSSQETNNTAEYHGLLLALKLAEELQIEELQIFMDSELIVKQMRGQYLVKAPHLRVLYNQSKVRSRSFRFLQFDHIPRDQNALADKLANEALDHQAAQSQQQMQSEVE